MGMPPRLFTRGVPAFAASLALILGGCAAATPLSQPAKHFSGVSTCARAITTDSEEAQAWFDQGLTLLYGFNHDEATRSFHAATVADPDCTMAWWGLAIASGIDLNDGRMSREDCRRAYDAAQQAVATSAGKPDLEVGLANAIATRFSWPPPGDRRPLDEAYAAAMEEVYDSHSDDVDVATLYADSLMALNPWHYWTPENEFFGRSEEAVEVLEAALKTDPDHAGATHYLIHILEVGDPARAEAAADQLADAVPGAGHLLHMPSHIYVHIGRYDSGVDANVDAIAADEIYLADIEDPGNYLGYYAHNVHMLAYCAMMEGREEMAMDAARQLERDVTDDHIADDPAWLDGLMATPLHVMVRFGRWEDLLDEPEPASFRYFSRAQWHYARGVAMSALGLTDRARRELADFKRVARMVPESWNAGSNPSSEVLDIAGHMFEAELLWREGDTEGAFEHMREGVAVEDAMRYGEPPGWMQPVRHAYGALLMADGQAELAESVYLTDLEKNPGNGWSLLGLQLALAEQGKMTESREAGRELAQVWDRADINPGSSCFCEPGEVVDA